MEPNPYLYDDELRIATPAACLHDEHSDIIQHDAPNNPFYSADPFSQKEDDLIGYIKQDYSRERRNTTHTQIVGSPDMAIHNKKNGKAKTGNPMLQKLSRAWGHEDAKSEIPMVKQVSIDKSIISLPPGTPKSACTLYSKNLNHTIDTTLSASNFIECKTRKSSVCQAEKFGMKLESKRAVTMEQSMPEISSSPLDRSPKEIYEKEIKTHTLGCCRFDDNEHNSTICCVIV